MLALPGGNYTLTVVGVDGQVGGAYSFRLDNLASATALTPGTAVSDTLNPANGTNLYHFNAAAGQSFYFANLAGGSSNNIWWRLIDPYSNSLFSKNFAIDGGRVTFTASGTYTVLIEGVVGNTGTLSYSFDVAPIMDTTQTLTPGSLVNGNLAEPGQQDTYTFNLAANALLYFDSLTNSANIQWSLTGPSGTAVNNRLFNNSDSGDLNANPVLLSPAGAYTLIVSGKGQGTGAYSFRLSELSTATPLTPGTAVQGTLNPANSTQIYQFSAAAGQSFYFAGNGGSGDARWRLVDPYGNLMFRDISEPLANDYGRLTLTASGTYTILIEGPINDTGTASYSFNVIPIADKTQALTLGSLVNGSLASPSEQDHYTFNITASTRLYFDSLTNSGSFQWSLTGPSGTIVNNRSFISSDGNTPFITNGGSTSNPVLALPAGTYTLTVTATAPTTGAYAFRLSDLSTARPLTLGTAVSSTLNPANSTQLFQFSAAAGQSVYFAQLSSSGGHPWWRLIDSYGNMLFNTSFSNDGGRLTLSAGGIYTVLVEGAIGDTGTTSYSFNVAPIADKTQALTLGSLVNGSLASPSEQDHYTFNVTASTRLYFDSLTNNANLQWSLTGPVGTAVNNRSFAASDASNVNGNPVLSLPAGSYTLTVSGTGQTAGAYTFRLSNLATATALTPGTPVSGTLNPANSTQIYQFTANTADQAGSGRESPPSPPTDPDVPD